MPSYFRIRTPLDPLRKWYIFANICNAELTPFEETVKTIITVLLVLSLVAVVGTILFALFYCITTKIENRRKIYNPVASEVAVEKAEEKKDEEEENGEEEEKNEEEERDQVLTDEVHEVAKKARKFPRNQPNRPMSYLIYDSSHCAFI